MTCKDCIHCEVCGVWEKAESLTQQMEKAETLDCFKNKADVEEVKHGYNKSSMNPVDEFICSECGAMFADVSLVKEDEENGDINYYEFEFKYCPNCGAKMDGAKMSEIPTGSERSD